MCMKVKENLKKSAKKKRKFVKKRTAKKTKVKGFVEKLNDKLDSTPSVQLDEEVNDAIMEDLYAGGYGSKFDLDKTGTPSDGIDKAMRDAMGETMDLSRQHFNDELMKLLKQNGLTKDNAGEFRTKLANTKQGGFFNIGNLYFTKTCLNKIIKVDDYIFSLESATIDVQKQFSKLQIEYTELKELTEVVDKIINIGFLRTFLMSFHKLFKGKLF